MKGLSIAAILVALPLSLLLGCQKAAVANGSKADTGLLIQQLKAPDAGKRTEAAFSLGQSGAAAKAAVPALIEALRDSEYSVRGQAAKALGAIGPAAKSAVPSLMDALADKDVVESVAGALDRLGEGAAAAKRLTEIVKDAKATPEARAVAIMGLKRAGDRKAAVALMISIIEDKTAVPQVRSRAALAVGHLGHEGLEEAKSAVPALLQSLDQPDVTSGPWSLWALGATDQAVARLTELVGHHDPQVRGKAASGLVHMAGGNPPPEARAAVPALIAALKTKDDARTAVISALGAIGPDAKEALPALMVLLKDDDQSTRDRANDAIKKIAPNP